MDAPHPPFFREGEDEFYKPRINQDSDSSEESKSDSEEEVDTDEDVD